MITTLITFTLLATILYFASTTIGEVLTYKNDALKKYKTNSTLTINTVIGLTFIIFICSIYYTKFKTINLLFLIPLITYLLLNQSANTHKLEIKWNKKWNQSIEFAGTFGLLFILSLFWDYSQSINNDMFLYANIGESLTKYGHENIFHYFNSILEPKNTTGAFPYHYYEFWTLAIFKPIFGYFSSIIVLKYLVYTFFKTTIVLGIKSIVVELTKNKSKFIGLTIILISLIPFDQFLNLFDAGWSYYISIWTRPNFLPYLFFLIPFTLTIIKKDYVLAILFLICLPIVSTVTAPSIFIFATLLTIGLAWFNKINKKEFIILFITIIVLALSILFFYKYLGIEIKSLKLSLEELITNYKVTWKAMVFYLVTLPAGLLTVLLPLYYLNKQIGNNKQLLLLILSSFCISIFGIIVFQLGNFIDNFYQFPYVGYSFVYLLSVIILGTAIFSKNTIIKRLSIALTIVGFAFSLQNVTIPKRLNIIENNILSKESKSDYNFEGLFNNKAKVQGRGLLILDKNTIASIPPKKRDLISNQYGNFLYYINSSIELLPYTSKEIYYFDEKENSPGFNKAHSYNDLLPEELFSGDLNNIESIIEKYNIEFLYITGEDNLELLMKRYNKSNIIAISKTNYLLIL
jgi:hypothetical protein